MNHADENRKGELARNAAVALRFKKSQGTPAMPQVEKEVLAPNYDRVRGGNFHLASNARDQGWPHPGMYLRTAFPDRVDVIEEVIAEGDRVGLLFRVTATHTGNFFGIPATGKRVDVYEIAWLRIVDGQMVEGWFMMDETELLKQLGAKMPPRKDGLFVAPPLPNTGEDADAFVRRLSSRPQAAQQDRNKLTAARSRSSASSKQGRAADHRQRRTDSGSDCLQEGGLAAARFAREPVDLVATDGERDVVDGAHLARLGEERGPQIFDFEKRLHASFNLSSGAPLFHQPDGGSRPAGVALRWRRP